MERNDMIKRLEAGEKAIDLSIEKWEDILEGTGTDKASDNCACCYVSLDVIEDCLVCSTCPIDRYNKEQDKCDFCDNLPSEIDRQGVKKAIEYLKKVKEWMIKKGEYIKEMI